MAVNDDHDVTTSPKSIRFTKDGVIDMGGVTCAEFYDYVLAQSGIKLPERKLPEEGPKWPERAGVWLEEPNMVFDAQVWCMGISLSVDEAKGGLSRQVHLFEHSCDWDFEKQRWGPWGCEHLIILSDGALKRFFAWYKEQEENYTEEELCRLGNQKGGRR